MSSELQHFLQFTDKWSKRRFALKLHDSEEFANVKSALDYLKSLSETDITALITEERLSDRGSQGLEDMLCFIFYIDVNGSLGDIIKNVKIKQHGRTLDKGEALKFEHKISDKEGYADVYVAELILDRDSVRFEKNWNGFYKRKWDRNPDYKEFVKSVIRAKFPEQSEKILARESAQDMVDFLKAVSGKIYNAPYELYSRFTGRNLRYKTGPETLDCIMSGSGGNCSEKAAAFEFIAVNYDIPCRIVLGGHEAKGEFPHNTLRRTLDEFDFRFKDDAQRYWDHFANLFEVGGTKILVDATGGPVPFLFCEGDEADDYLSQKKYSRLWFLAEQENYYYHDASDKLAHDTLFSLEALVPDVDLYHVLGPEDDDSPFGFIVTDDVWVCPTVYKTESEYSKYKQEWEEWGRETERVSRLEVYPNLDASVGKALLEKLEESNPVLVADLRTAEDNFVERCRQSWREKEWNSGFVIAEFKKMN